MTATAGIREGAWTKRISEGRAGEVWLLYRGSCLWLQHHTEKYHNEYVAGGDQFKPNQHSLK